MITPALASDWQGRSVVDLLTELRAEGFAFIYNDDVLPRDLTIGVEPHARSGIALADEVLRAHALALKLVAPRTYIVVRQAETAASVQVDSPRPAPPIEEVIVQSSRYRVANESAPETTFLAHEEVQRLPRFAEETLQAVQRLPGVAGNGFSSLASIRGGATNETLILLDGLRLYEPFHLKNFMSPVSLLDSRMIEGMDVSFGGFPVNQGDRMSAVIDARSLRPEAPRYYEAGLSLYHTSALASMELLDGRARALLSGRRSNLGEVAAMLENDYGDLHYADGFGRFDYRVSDATDASFHVLASRDEITAIKDDGLQTSRAGYENHYAWGALEHRWSDEASSTLVASYTQLENERYGEVNDPGRRVGVVDDQRDFNIAGLRNDNTLRRGALTQRFGLELRRVWGEYEYRSDVRLEPDQPLPGLPGRNIQRDVSPAPHGYEAAAYWDGRVDVNARWVLEAGLRVDQQTYDDAGDAAQWSPRLNVLYRLAPQTSLRASWGRFHQSQAINELQVEDNVDQFHPAQRVDHAILSFDHAFRGEVDLRLEGWRKDYRRQSPRFENLFNPISLLPEIEFDRVMIDPDKARSRGVDLLLRVRPHGPWSGWLAYTWSRAEDSIDGRWALRSWDQTHAINVGVSWNSGPWTVIVSDAYHTGWPITEAALSSSGPDATFIVGPRNAARLAAYNTLDLRVTRSFALHRGVLDVFVEANNALSRENPCCVEYRAVPNAAGGWTLNSETDAWLPVTPTVGVLWRYE